MDRVSREPDSLGEDLSRWARRTLLGSLIFLPGASLEKSPNASLPEIPAAVGPVSEVDEGAREFARLFSRWLSAPAEEPYPDDLPPIEVPDVVDETFSPNEALADCAREQEVACVTIQGPGILECASMREGDHVPLVVTDTSPMRRFFMNRGVGGEDTQVFSMTMQVAPAGFVDFTSPESAYVLDRSNPSDVRLQLGLLCQALVEEAHRTEFDADWFCGTEESEEACAQRWDASIQKAQRIRDFAPLVEEMELTLLELELEGVRPNSVFQQVELLDGEGNPRTVQFSVVQVQSWNSEEDGFGEPTLSFGYNVGGFGGVGDSPDAAFQQAQDSLFESE